MSFTVEISKLEEKGPLIQADIAELVKKVGSLQVKNKEDFTVAANFLGEIKTRLKRLEELRKEATSPLNDYVKKLNNAAKSKSVPLEELEIRIKTLIKVYLDEEARKAQAEADRLRKEQEEKERLEQAKLEEARRKEEEARRAEQKARDEAFEAKNKKDREAAEKRAAEEAAKAAEEKAKAEAAQKELENTEVAVVEAPAKSIRTDAGLVTRKLTWAWKVTDPKLLKKTYPDLFILDTKKVDYMVNEGARNIPGLNIYQESDVAMKV